ncbi:MAG TPA: FGGY family carbohydrate kinase [Candidatus Atribacteria bacterium]|nr:FGGY family carbohydrate kinase [Candidatus Atribacteria bacterium]
MALLLGIDVGTTNTKLRVYNHDGEIKEERSFPTPLFPDEEGELYHPQKILHQILQAISQFSGELRREIIALSVSSYAEVLVKVGENGEPVGGSIPWYDNRTEKYFREIELDKEEVYRISGLYPYHIYSFYKLFWHREREKEAFEKTKFWTSMSGFILFYFSGIPSFDYSLASRTMLFRQKERCWWEEMLARAGLSAKDMAPLYPSGVVLGTVREEVARDCGLSLDTLVVTGGHDHLCAALSVGVYREGRALISTGTTESLTMALENLPSLSPSGEEKPFSWGHHVAYPYYYAMNGIYSGGYAVDWILRLLKEDYAFLENLSPHFSPRVPIFFPYLLGGDYEGAKGAFLNLTGGAEREELILGLLLGLCFEYRNIWEKMEKNLGFRIKETANVGGGTQNRVWMELKATTLDKNIPVPRDREGSCRGAALLAGLGAGVYKDFEEAFQKTFRVREVFEPQKEWQESLEKWFRVYVEVEKDLREINEKLGVLYDR